ncbi:general secretion pathway protein A [Clostridium pasteurianum DSM 525 = ATCC 6013]|uniref:General secretion pathway protein A n=1 Tax=Clostridium pasteurianum DSM 525 = ATCC 6013 TaxID=1262449 RepID=A0A0H3J588_CLOPA|nr:AAA family ATPase [Clostridium pasteurianum]AJA46743.1 general secretion pathway protein A [Clostridium pasteurianum DSM 525 = ATCC 6013]AJA47006.1 general secretion pathway protein A [Clostridium pasteurianum DSM 525 = ATCC 6013]AJA47254.1 general secretion pathway protein A [Clostridium pasteurianum DSM 525 = ATCC 6013]AJA47475.1 general secretion pathway protein A [Clostridium pasteurianum DSM 525 = ATCC 6013]AJA47663.1 general secretion pathway protein A [Clostridium pasteurianum DSM 52
MYKAFYGLTFDPFDKNLDLKYSFKSEDFSKAMNRLEFLKSVLGIGVITGEPGVGKSFLLRNFVDSLNPNLYKCVYIPISTLTVMDFYRALCDGLGIIHAQKKVTMFKQIQESIYTYSHSKNVIPVIIIDECQFLSNSILDDLRIIFNFHMDSKNYAMLILSGQPNFLLQLSRQVHEALRQRIIMNYCLKGLTHDECKPYITSMLKAAGCSEPIFTDDAFELIYSSTNGAIRPLNSLTRMCLISGANERLTSINSDTVYKSQSEIDLTI